ncbi:MAG: PmoA family protein [Saprospiraceae bacterium]|nr:PmoA family protein [Saprospiraceae bacterium]
MTKNLLFAILSAFLVCPAICQKKNILSSEKKDGALITAIAGKPVLAYQYETVYPPADVDTAYKKSGFIHPLSTLNGHVLTQIQPKDHYHHYGIWNPWTHVLFEGDTLDFWNLYKKEATVRFAEFKYIKKKASFIEFKVLHEHLVLKNAAEKVVLNEFQTIKVSPVTDHYYIVDFTIDYACAMDRPFKILEYRYAGFGWRATEAWDKNNSEILTSEGKTRLDADGSTARWCIVQGALGKDYGGVILLSHPKNFNHPEPLRVWPVEQNGRGDVFVNIAPTKTRDWLLKPGKTYTLKYRLIVFNNKFSAIEAEQLWKKYAAK